MCLRSIQWALILVVVASAGCETGSQGSVRSKGCTGVCSDGGGDAGGDAGEPWGEPDAGSGPSCTVAQLRALPPMGQRVRVEGVVVHGVGRVWTTNCQAGSYRAELWVTDPADPDAGLFLNKGCADDPSGYLPDAGDLLTVDGFWISSPTVDQYAYRPFLSGSPGGRLSVEVMGTRAVPPPRQVDAGGFGDAAGGLARPDPGYAGAFVHIQGPLEITNATPPALQKLRVLADGGLAPDGWAGFEVTGGILVIDARTAPGCDWRAAADAGVRVVFPGGISGAWDTYAHEPACAPLPFCLVPAYVPGAGDAGYTYALYPTSCDRDLDGGVATP